MLLVKLTTSFPDDPVQRQTPGGIAVWNDCQFIVNTPVQECDAWVVFEGLPGTETSRCATSRMVFVSGEPPDYKNYANGFLQQFGAVVTCHPKIQHANVFHSQQALPWHVGMDRGVDAAGNQGVRCTLTFDDLASMHPAAKRNAVSVCCSTKTRLPGHRQRIAFVKALKERLGDRLDWFGKGVRSVGDKWQAIAPYKYHIALENSAVDHYWTEKLADAFLGYALPLYWGCPNIDSYFPGGSILKLDIRDVEGSARMIQGLLDNERTYHERLPAIHDARARVLNEYNLFAMLSDLVQRLPDGERRQVTLKPEQDFVHRSLPYRTRRLIGRARRFVSGPLTRSAFSTSN